MESSTSVLACNQEDKWALVKQQTIEIKNDQNNTIGTGFFIGNDGLLITCAHVVKEAGGHEKLKINGMTPELAYSLNTLIDVALLKLPECTTKSVPLGTEYDLNSNFLSFGYGRATDFPSGETISGQITDSNKTALGDILMLRLTGFNDCQRVEGGASGSPVYDIERQKVIGLICAHDRNEGALALPFSELCKSIYIIRDRLNPGYQAAQQKIQDLHNLILKEHLSTFYQNLELVNQHTFEEYFSFFKLISDVESYNLSSFKELEDIVSTSSRDETIFWIGGAPGTGKSSFLNLVYWFFYQAFQTKRKILPVYLNLHRYSRLPQNQVVNNISTRINTCRQDQISFELASHLEPLQELLSINQDQQMLIIIDGYDNYSSIENEVFQRVIETYFRDKNCLYIIGFNNKYNNLTNEIALQDPTKIFIFNTIKRDSKLLQQVVQAFLKITLPRRYAETAEFLMEIIDQYKLENIDIFTLSLLKCRTRRGCISLPSLSHIIQSYCSTYLSNVKQFTGASNRRGALNRAAQLAFASELKGGDGASIEDEVLLDLIHTHPRIKDYLIAKCIVSHLNRISGQLTDNNIQEVVNILKCVQPSRINNYCKEIINQVENNSQSCLNAAEILLASDLADANTKSFLCYMLGRLEVNWHDKAYLVLENFKTRLDQYRDTLHYHFLLRTSYISLIMLGGEKYKDEYIGCLLADRTFDQVNRGFHLEYYEDQPIVDPSNLPNKDNLGDFSKTYSKLTKDLQEISRKNPVFDIQLHTLCSLAQHRHVAKKLSEDKRLDLIKTIKWVLKNKHISNAHLKRYVKMVVRHLSDPYFSTGKLFENLYRIKITKRQGWLIRGMKNGESVADHSFGSYLIALLLLPENNDNNDNNDNDDNNKENKYSKQKIIDMILIHDLAEAITHDIPSGIMIIDDNLKEQEVFNEIELFSTYNTKQEEEVNYIKIAKLYREFTQKDTFNARIAKEIDALENWIQLQVYKAEGHEILNYEQWCESLKDKIQTSIGISMLNRLVEIYTDLKKIKSTYSKYRSQDEGLGRNRNCNLS